MLILWNLWIWKIVRRLSGKLILHDLIPSVSFFRIEIVFICNISST